MSLTATNAKSMRFSLRYPPDKIMGIFEGSFTATASGTPGLPYRTNYSVPHGFSNWVFVQVRYSLDGGTSWQDQHSTVPDLSVPTAPVLQTCDVGVYSTTSDIVIVASNFTASTKTIQFEAVAYSVGDVSYGNPTTSLSSNPAGLLLSTRYNIQKIYDEGVTSVPVSATVTPTEYTVTTHDLGYVPTIRMFYVPVAGQLWPISPNQYGNNAGGSGTSLTIFGAPVISNADIRARLSNSSSATSIDVYWRIYIDE